MSRAAMIITKIILSLSVQTVQGIRSAQGSTSMGSMLSGLIRRITTARRTPSSTAGHDAGPDASPAIVSSKAVAGGNTDCESLDLSPAMLKICEELSMRRDAAAFDIAVGAKIRKLHDQAKAATDDIQSKTQPVRSSNDQQQQQQPKLSVPIQHDIAEYIKPPNTFAEDIDKAFQDESTPITFYYHLDRLQVVELYKEEKKVTAIKAKYFDPENRNLQETIIIPSHEFGSCSIHEVKLEVKFNKCSVAEMLRLQDLNLLNFIDDISFVQPEQDDDALPSEKEPPSYNALHDLLRRMPNLKGLRIIVHANYDDRIPQNGFAAPALDLRDFRSIETLHMLHAPCCIKTLPAKLKVLKIQMKEHKLRFPALPDSLQELHWESRATKPPRLPNGLKTLHLNSHPLKSLRSWPSGLKKLRVDSCYMRSLPRLPTGLEELELWPGYKLRSFPKLPVGLKRLKFHGDFFYFGGKLPSTLKELHLMQTCIEESPLPSGLKRLHLRSVSLPSWFQFPDGLEELHVMYDDDNTELPAFPPQLKILSLDNSINFTSLPDFPDSLEILEIKELNESVVVPAFPPKLKKLHLARMSRYTSGLTFPVGLEDLSFSEYHGEKLPAFPPSLKRLALKSMNRVTSLPTFPTDLEYLDIREFGGLESIPELPLNLKMLVIMHMDLVGGLPKLPSGIHTLSLKGVRGITTSLDGLPASLEELIVQCMHLKSIILPQSTSPGQNTSTRQLKIQWFDVPDLKLVTLPDNLRKWSVYQVVTYLVRIQDIAELSQYHHCPVVESVPAPADGLLRLEQVNKKIHHLLPRALHLDRGRRNRAAETCTDDVALT